MREEVVKYCCDFCGKEIDPENEEMRIGVPIPCLRTIEDCEGRYTLKTPVVSIINLDLCEEHFNKIITCSVYGAQGYDTVKIKETNEDTGKNKRFRVKRGKLEKTEK